MNKSTLSLASKDMYHQLHPYTDARAHLTVGPLIIERGEGIYVYDDQGNKYIEGMSGLWSAALGFSNERLIRAAEKQLRQLPFYHLFNHKSHAPSIELAERLVDLAPVPMSKVFFTNSGSEANDTVVKLIWYRNNAIGKPEKKKFISRESAYHGVTIASASLTGLPANHRGYDLPLPGFLHVSCPHHYRHALPGESEELFADRLAAELEAKILSEGPETVAAFIGEPLMGAGGVIVPPRTYWKKIQEVCRKYDVLIVADEVICGFGRTGQMFGCETFDIKPDIMVVSKQLSSSYQPIAAVLITQDLFDGIADQSQHIGTLGHGLTGGGHPVATAVALENLKVIQEDGLVEHAAHMGRLLHAGLQRSASHPLVGELRGTGFIAAVELTHGATDDEAFAIPGKLGRLFASSAQKHGLITRNMGNAIAFCPPLITTELEVGLILERFECALETTAKLVSD